LKEELKPAKQQFKEEKMKPKNSKAVSQPLRAKSDVTLKKRDINQAGQCVGNLEGNGVQKSMAEAPSIIAKIEEHFWELRG
jgi:hypothetical protein